MLQFTADQEGTAGCERLRIGHGTCLQHSAGVKLGSWKDKSRILGKLQSLSGLSLTKGERAAPYCAGGDGTAVLLGLSC